MNPAEWQRDLTRLSRKGGSPEIRRLLREVHDKGGWEGKLAGSGHFRLRHIASNQMVTVSHTAGHPRSILNTRSKIKQVERAA